MKLRVYSDGTSRGNPGPSSIAYLILSEDRKKIAENSEYIGVKTNNQAEYEALISALEFAYKLESEEVSCYVDSELLAKQLNGEYQVRNPKLSILWLKVRKLMQKFQIITFTYKPRTNIYIQQVDKLANKTLDSLERTKKLL